MSGYIQHWQKQNNFKKSDVRVITQKIKKKLSSRKAENLHLEAFQKIDCLECANCCKSIPPIITKSDSKRISKKLGLKESDFIEQYTTEDNDGDRVFKTSPCKFLQEDNTCLIYNDRPKACRRYPHTDKGELIKHPELLGTNSMYCPAAYYILQKINEQFN